MSLFKENEQHKQDEDLVKQLPCTVCCFAMGSTPVPVQSPLHGRKLQGCGLCVTL